MEALAGQQHKLLEQNTQLTEEVHRLALQIHERVVGDQASS
jgi:hypothetical protein